MTQKSLSNVWVFLFFISALFFACGGDKSDNQPPKTERPKLVVNKWHLDTADYRGLYRRYADVLWEKFADAESSGLSGISKDEIKKKREESEVGLWIKCNEEIAAMFFDFKADGAYEFRYRGGGEKGTYQFTPSMDSIRLRPDANPNGYKLPVPVLSDSVMKLTMRWPILTATKDSDERWFEVEAKYIPMK